MKKSVEKAFAIALIILSIIGTIWKTDLISSIIYSVVIPSFILSLISFVSEISEKCQTDAEKTADTTKRLSDLEEEMVNKDIQLYAKGKYETPYVEGVIPDEIFQRQKDSNEHLEESIVYTQMAIFCIKCKKTCDKLIVFGYVLLFISLCLSPYFENILSNINLNCITLWSLTLLYITLELKSELCAKTFNFIYRKYKKSRIKKKGDSVLNSKEN